MNIELLGTDYAPDSRHTNMFLRVQVHIFNDKLWSMFGDTCSINYQMAKYN
jgi:hypothetical protein